MRVLLAVFSIYSIVLNGAVEKPGKLVVADQLLAQNASIDQKYSFEFRGKRFVGYPNIYSPVIFPGASKQADIAIREGERFLEIGSGTGVFSVLAAIKGAEVVAIDINPDAVANTLENAKLHGVENRLIALQGDLFQPLGANSAFDLIFFNIPFCHRNCKVTDLTPLARSLFDPEHDLLHRYLKEGKNYLKPNGRLLLGYSTTHGDIELMHKWANEYNWKTTLLHKLGDESLDFITIELYEFRENQ